MNTSSRRIIGIAAAVCLFFASSQIVGTAPDIIEGETLHTGMKITPAAAPGAVFQTLNPDLPDLPDFVAGQAVSTALSPDGKTLLILTSGYNRMNRANGTRNAAWSNEYVFVYDVSGAAPVKQQVLTVPNTFNGLVWNPSGQEFYVSGGRDDNMRVFAKVGERVGEPGHRGPGKSSKRVGRVLPADGRGTRGQFQRRHAGGGEHVVRLGVDRESAEPYARRRSRSAAWDRRSDQSPARQAGPILSGSPSKGAARRTSRASATAKL